MMGEITLTVSNNVLTHQCGTFNMYWVTNNLDELFF